MTPCFFLQNYESSQVEQILAALKNVGLSVLTYSFSANETGVHGVHPEPADSAERRPALARQADSRRRCWRARNQCGSWTAVCSGYLEQLCTALVSRKAFSLGFLSFLQIKSYYTDSKPNSENSLLSHSLTLAPRCPVGRFVPAARVVCPTGERAGTNRATADDRLQPSA